MRATCVRAWQLKQKGDGARRERLGARNNVDFASGMAVDGSMVVAGKKKTGRRGVRVIGWVA